jgi:hypothetical protein
MKKDSHKLKVVDPKSKAIKVKVAFDDEQALEDVIEFMQSAVDSMQALKNEVLEQAASESGQKVPAWKLGLELSSGDTIMLGRPLN